MSTADKNARDWDLAFKKFEKRLDGALDMAMRRATFKMINEIASDWPYPHNNDTGRSRAGWIAVPLTAKGYASGAVAPLTNAISDMEIKTQRGVKTLTAVNPVEYAPHLEYGTDKIAPGHHIRGALFRARSEFPRVLGAAIKRAWKKDQK